MCDGAPWIEIFAGRSVPVGDSGSKRADASHKPFAEQKEKQREGERERERADLRFYEGHRYYGGKSVAHLRDVPSILERHRGGHWRNAYLDVLVNLSNVISSAVTSRVHLLGCP